MVTSPSTENYLVGKGSLYFTPVGGVRRHMGNVSAMEVNLEVEELDHYSSMEGIRSKDKSVVVEKAGNVRLTLDEWSIPNIALAMLGTVGTDTDGNNVVELFNTDKQVGRLEYEGNNDVGPVFYIDLPSVAFRPDAAFSPISEEWATMEILGELQISNGSWGTITEIVTTETESA